MYGETDEFSYNNDNALVYIEAMIEARSGRKDVALHRLRNVFEQGYSVEEAVNDPELGRIRSDPAFAKLVAESRTRRGRS